MTTATGYFAERLKTLREEKGVSQYALAKLAGLSKQALSRLELSERDPTWNTVQLLAAALNVDYAAFADPAIKLPTLEPARPRGRPRKASTEVAPSPENGKPQTTTRKRKTK